MKIDKLTLIAGVDVPIPSLSLSLHVPTLKEIGYIGENNFFVGCGLLTFSKRIMSKEDKERLKTIDDFNVLMLIINDKTSGAEIKDAVLAMLQVLMILFPTCEPLIRKDCIVLKEYDGEQTEHIIGTDAFKAIRSVVAQEFGLGQEEEYQEIPENESEMAKRIREKIEEGKRKVAQIKSKEDSGTVLDRYISITAIYYNALICDLINCTIYQLFDMFQRAQLKDEFDSVFKLRIAGAKDVKDAEDWTKDIHSKAL